MNAAQIAPNQDAIDEALERQIDQQYDAFMRTLGTPQCREHFWGMSKLIGERSGQQIERMERQRGLRRGDANS